MERTISRSDYADKIKDCNRRCAEIRGKIKERSPIDNHQHFAFVLTSKERNEQIVNYYRKKYRDKAAIKECLAEYNCLYGVQNEDVFVTALNESAENLDEWESKNGISLPESYIHFLTFADGILLSGCHQELYDLEGIVLSDEHIEEDYMIIGNMIGDEI